MTCYHPLEAWQTEDGSIVFAERGRHIRRPLSLPCGQCIGCRIDRSRSWAARCVHESQLHDFSSFITLTYSDSNLPFDLSLNYRHFQLFLKRLRKRFGQARFYMCGEYGDKYLRPHYHACLFGVHFADRYVWRQSEAGFTSYRSPILDSLWPLGSAECGDVTFQSAAYVARYCLKKVTGSQAGTHYERLHTQTGEVTWAVPEFTHMSLKPGIGEGWIAKFYPEVFAHKKILVDGKRVSIPRFYRDYLDSVDGDFRAQCEKAVYDCLTPEVLAHTTRERLAVRETVVKASMAQFMRDLE